MLLMFQNNKLWLFLTKFLLIYIIATIPVLPFFNVYAHMMRNLSEVIFHEFGEKGEARIIKYNDRKFDTKIIVYNKALKKSDGTMLGIANEFSLYISGYIPLSLITGLIFASYVSWNRRIVSWIISFIVLGIILMFKIWFSIIVTIYKFPDLSFPLNTNYTKERIENIFTYFVANPEPQYIFCVIFWLMITFRNDDWNKFILFSRKF